jgi:hypothetical protein
MTTAVERKQEDLIGGLVEALLSDGFTGYCCGPTDDPHAVIAVYEWPNHVDVITLHRKGHAAAARILTPGGVRAPQGEPNPIVLNPPATVTWGFEEGPIDSAVWAMLDLPHPKSLDAPAAEMISTPAALWVPRELQRPMRIRVPDPEKIDARAARLSQPGPPKILSEQWFNDLLGYVDSGSAIAFASNFAPDDCEFTWGNFPTLTGRTAITEFTQGFFSMVDSVSHQVDSYHLWGEDLYATTTGKVTFTKLDGSSTVTVPFATGSHFTPDGTKMTDYTVWLDPSPLVGVTVPA